MSLPDLPDADRVCDVCDHVYHCGGGRCSDRAFVEANWHRLERAEKRIATLENLALRMRRVMRSVSLPADDIAGQWQEVLREADQVLVEGKK
jgi:hypothetical protein